MNQEKIGSFIAQRRKDKKLTQAKLASYLGISDRTISKWERGKGLPDPMYMLELCQILDISVISLRKIIRLPKSPLDLISPVTEVKFAGSDDWEI